MPRTTEQRLEVGNDYVRAKNKDLLFPSPREASDPLLIPNILKFRCTPLALFPSFYLHFISSTLSFIERKKPQPNLNRQNNVFT